MSQTLIKVLLSRRDPNSIRPWERKLLEIFLGGPVEFEYTNVTHDERYRKKLGEIIDPIVFTRAPRHRIEHWAGERPKNERGRRIWLRLQGETPRGIHHVIHAPRGFRAA